MICPKCGEHPAMRGLAPRPSDSIHGGFAISPCTHPIHAAARDVLEVMDAEVSCPLCGEFSHVEGCEWAALLASLAKEPNQ